MQYKYLVNVDGCGNHNKFYEMIPKGTCWEARWGRIGAGSQSKTYADSQFYTKLDEKLRKGYIDQTHLRSVSTTVETKEPEKTAEAKKPITTAEKLMNRLYTYAKGVVSKNYRLKPNEATPDMVEQAQYLIDLLARYYDTQTVEWFNGRLTELFSVLPRRMSKVQDYLATYGDSAETLSKIIAREQEILNAMKACVVFSRPMMPDNALTDDDIKGMGITVTEVTADEEAKLKKMLGSQSWRYKGAWAVNNEATDKAFKKYLSSHKLTAKDTRRFFHGSRNENWLNILKTGLMCNPTNAIITGKMFGNGIYFAPKARKSIGYTSLSGSYWARGNDTAGFLAVMDVIYGTPFKTQRATWMTYDKLRKQKAHCVHAEAGTQLVNDEIIVYRDDQVTIRYLIELQ